MAITASLLHSDKWYKFLTQHAVNDAELHRCLKDYIAAHAKLTNRVTALADAHPDFDVEIHRVSKETVTGGPVEEIRAYHQKYGTTMTAQQINDEARSLGYELVHITEKNAS